MIFLIRSEIDEISSSSGSSDSMIKVSCDNNNLDSTSLTIKKKKRKCYKRLSINPTFMPALRIFRNDIRRRYIDMISNVLNNYDLNLHRQFCREFAVPNAPHTYHGFPPEFIALLQHSPQLIGLEQVLHTYELHYLMIPDIVFRYDNIKICKRLGCSGSRVIATVRTSGKMQFVLPKDNNKSNRESKTRYDSSLTSSSLPITSSTSETGSTSSNIVLSTDYNSKPIYLEWLPEPVDFDVIAMLIITLDEEHRFVSVDLHAM